MIEGDIFVDLTKGVASPTKVKTRKPDKIGEILTYRRKERLRDEAITLAEAKKKHIPVYRAKPHPPIKGKVFVDYTIKRRISPSKTKKPKIHSKRRRDSEYFPN